MIETLRIALTVLAFLCMCGFAPAIVHARDNTDRVFLLGTATLLSAAGVGSLAHLHDPIPPGVLLAICLSITGQILLLTGAYMSRRRRRRKASPPATGGRSG